jgi:hypothetical protein
MRTITIVTALVILTAAGALAADWQWPAQMSLGSFQISGINGTVNADESGTATGTLQIPDMGNSNVDLSRSSQGNITGTLSVDARVSGGTLQGSFTLSNSGLSGRGTLECLSRSIGSSDISISSRGEAKGSGRISIGRLVVQVDFSASDSSCSISGEAPVKAQVETPMATYKLNGRLAVRTSGGSLTGMLSGQVERTGNVSNQVTTSNIPNTRVDLSNGQCTVNVGGVSVTFSVL